jgi:two-component system LytT family response regulator
MIKAVIIDDEPLARTIVREYLGAFKEVELVAECGDGFEGVKAINQYTPELIFLDIQMPKINGFEMLELIDNPPAVIFTTAFDEYALRAFEAHAVDYLLKPFSKIRFEKAMEKFLEQQKTSSKRDTSPLLEMAAQSPAQNERVVVKIGGKIKIIPIGEIHFLEAADDYVNIHTAEGAFLKNRTMNYFEQLLNAQSFVRVHRSYMLNIQQITRIEPYEKETHLAVLKSGKHIPVSKAGYSKLRVVLGL